MNVVKTGMLLAAMTALFMGVGFLLGGSGGAVIALIVAAAMNLFTYWNSDKMVLRMHNAHEVDERSAPALHAVVRRLAEQAELPMPKVYLIDDPQPNAFATGRNPQNAAVAATTGLLNQLSEAEVAGVMAHELAHIRNRDTLIMTITATFAGAISMLANFALFFGGRDNNSPLGIFGYLAIMLLAPMAAMLVQMATSRTREYSADRLGAEIAGDPMALASALSRIAGAASRTPMMSAERSPATAPMFIINPLSGARMDNLFSTHPNTDNRIDALQQFAREGGFRPMDRRPARYEPAHHETTEYGPWSRPARSRPATSGPASSRPSSSRPPSIPSSSARRGPWG